MRIKSSVFIESRGVSKHTWDLMDEIQKYEYLDKHPTSGYHKYWTVLDRSIEETLNKAVEDYDKVTSKIREKEDLLTIVNKGNTDNPKSKTDIDINKLLTEIEGLKVRQSRLYNLLKKNNRIDTQE